MNWFKQLFHKPAAAIAPKPKPPRPASHDMTLERWQKDDGLVNWARTSQEFAWILSIAYNHRPVGFPLRGQVVTEIQCLVELGRNEGYADLENVLLALRRFPLKVKEEVQADYDDTDYDQKEA